MSLFKKECCICHENRTKRKDEDGDYVCAHCEQLAKNDDDNEFVERIVKLTEKGEIRWGDHRNADAVVGLFRGYHKGRMLIEFAQNDVYEEEKQSGVVHITLYSSKGEAKKEIRRKLGERLREIAWKALKRQNEEFRKRSEEKQNKAAEETLKEVSEILTEENKK